jgi:DNA-binding GntR family transcriptional regulator
MLLIMTRPGIPRYVQLADLLRERITDGTYPIGGRMPTEVALMEETGYSRDTVRAAVKLLKDAGWLTVTHGLGTYVNPPELRADAQA